MKKNNSNDFYTLIKKHIEKYYFKANHTEQNYIVTLGKIKTVIYNILKTSVSNKIINSFILKCGKNENASFEDFEILLTIKIYIEKYLKGSTDLLIIYADQKSKKVEFKYVKDVNYLEKINEGL